MNKSIAKKFLDIELLCIGQSVNGCQHKKQSDKDKQQNAKCPAKPYKGHGQILLQSVNVGLHRRKNRFVVRKSIGRKDLLPGPFLCRCFIRKFQVAVQAADLQAFRFRIFHIFRHSHVNYRSAVCHGIFPVRGPCKHFR